MTDNIIDLQKYKEKKIHDETLDVEFVCLSHKRPKRTFKSKYGLDDIVEFKEPILNEVAEGVILQVKFSENLILYSVQDLRDLESGGCYIYDLIAEKDIVRVIN